ncbi:hypothetical protein BXT84_09625 [Sulfobacillus thermotolerans]|uniref:Uncharacterized protein n=1 Tax=Sulfobacillus thermotolerans TaxID=338644 RepID=A0ABN5H2V6_9FIRM|nr:hypothetical protein BXT84_09625 [Sulfobacillus thermotolerans]
MHTVMATWERDAALRTQLTPERLEYWQRLSGFAELPHNWADIWAGWVTHHVFCLNASKKARLTPLQILDGRESQGYWALATIFHHKLWVFSHQAVYYGACAWKSWDIHAVVGHGQEISWMNDMPGFNGKTLYIRCPSPIPGFWAARSADHVLLWHPLILGPVGEWVEGRLVASVGLAAEYAPPREWKIRGEAVAGGVWGSTGLRPLPALEGWFSEQSIWQIEEMNS